MNVIITIKKTTLYNIACTLLYCVAFMLCYVFFLNKHFEYAGFTYYPKNFLFILLAVFIAIIPIRFFSGYKAISSFICIFIYTVLYIPIITTFALGSNLSMLHILGIQLIFMLCMIVLFQADKFTIKTKYKLLSSKKISRNMLFKAVLWLTILSTIYVLYIYRGNLRFVSFDQEVYELRFANQVLGEGLVIRYLLAWLSNLFIPICLAYGLVYKKRVYFLVSTAACIIIYMATGSKGIILFPLIFAGLYLLKKVVSFSKLYLLFTSFLALLLIALLLTYRFSYTLFFAMSMLSFRTIGTGGYLTMWYYDFFSTHPKTYYSHINAVNAITDSYPYGDAGIGQVIGQHYWVNSMNANANFWATDGIAALGLPGIFIATICLFIFLVICNSISKSINKTFVMLAFVPFIYFILNTSLFSSLLSGGAIFLAIFIFLLKKSAPLK